MHDYSECTDDQILSTTDADWSPSLADYPANGENSQSQKDTMTSMANEISMSEFADRVYAARKLYIKAAGVADWETIIDKRYTEERELLLDKLDI